MIKSIETNYNSLRFRSRLEARWAIFFDKVGIKYEYEKEGFDLGDGIYYLPDFWLPELDMFVEVKGNVDEILKPVLNEEQIINPETKKIDYYTSCKWHDDLEKVIRMGKNYKIALVGNIPNPETICQYTNKAWSDYDSIPKEGYCGAVWGNEDNGGFGGFENFFYKCRECGQWNFIGIKEYGDDFNNKCKYCGKMPSSDDVWYEFFDQNLEAYEKARQARFEYDDRR